MENRVVLPREGFEIRHGEMFGIPTIDIISKFGYTLHLDEDDIKKLEEVIKERRNLAPSPSD